MSELYFRAGETEGFTSKKLADKRSGYANPIRELLQNSLDASKDAGNETCEINIYIESIKTSDIPHIKDYSDALDTAISYQKKVGSFGHNAEQTVNFMKSALEKGELETLMFVDNGTGMSPDILNGLIGDRSVKSDESSGGSFGVGHLSSYFLSSLRYVLYASKYKSNNQVKTLFSGAPILAGFEDDSGIDRGSIGRILDKAPENELKPKFCFPASYPDFISEKMNDVDTGSMVTVLGLNAEWNRDANYAITSNFFYALNEENLVINVDEKGIPRRIDKSDVDRMLESSKDGKVASGDNILSGRDVYQLWQAVKDNELKKEIRLKSNDETVTVHIKNNIDTGSVIALVRNGMLIARHDKMLSVHMNNLRKSEDFESFAAVINIDDSSCPELFKLVKGAENPYHNRLENRLIPPEEKRLKILLQELSEGIKEFLNERDRSGSSVHLPFLEIPNKAEAQGGNASKPRSQNSKANSSRKSPKQPTGEIQPTGNGKKRPKPVIVNRVLESKTAVRFKDNEDNTLDVVMNINPQHMDSRDDVYFSVSLAMDTDNDAVDSALKIQNILVNNKKVDMPDFIEVVQNGETTQEPADKTQVNLGTLTEGQIYKVVATVEKPKKLNNIGVALKPFLGLKQHKGAANE